MTRIIAVIDGGALQRVYSDDPETEVFLLDYDNMKGCNLDDPDQYEEYNEYVDIEAILKNDNSLIQAW